MRRGNSVSDPAYAQSTGWPYGLAWLGRRIWQLAPALVSWAAKGHAPPRSVRVVGAGSVAIGTLLAGMALFPLFDANAAPGVVKIHTPLPITSLKSVPVPEPPATVLSKYIADEPTAVALGKALFWDMQVGSDNVQACATCHFSAGADNRSRNQLSPGLNVLPAPPGDITFQLGGPNYQLKATDYPFHKLMDVNDTTSAVISDTNDVTSSQGVVRRDFTQVAPPGSDSCVNIVDPDGFRVAGVNTRRVEPRNTPSVINAVFNYRNFWDGRAQFFFNGVNPFGARDPNAKVWSLNPQGVLHPVSVLIPFSSLASQAVGPPGSKFEMSCDNRAFREIGRKLLSSNVTPLASQLVASDDSVLGIAPGLGLARSIAAPGAPGLTRTYKDLVQKAFQPQWWNAAPTQFVTINGQTYTQMEANFSLFFGMAVQAYERTLVADNSKFDQFIEKQPGVTLTQQEQDGLALFTDTGPTQAHCAACHGGAELTNASVRNVNNEHIERMTMGNDGVAVYDNGFYNIGVRPTNDDIGVGGKDPFGAPLSETLLCQQDLAHCPPEVLNIAARPLESIPSAPLATQCPAGAVTSVLVTDPVTGTQSYSCDRTNVMGAFKAPGLRNVELTAPYFHNGGQATLRQVVDFYNRKGDFAVRTQFNPGNEDNLDPNITRLGLSDYQKDALVAFLLTLTDDRVKYERAPFDHPALCIPNGHPGDQTGITSFATVDGVNVARDDTPICLPPVGAGGSAGVSRFLNLANPFMP